MPSQTKKITIDTAALLFGRVTGLVLGIIRLRYLAVFLGVAGFGILNFALYFCSLFQVFFDIGISQFLTREVARHPDKSRELIGKTLVLKGMVISLASFVVIAITYSSSFDSVTFKAVLFTTAALALNSLSAVFMSAFQAHRRMTLVSLITIVNDALLSGSVILLIQDFPYIDTVLYLTIVVAFFQLSLLFILYRLNFGSPQVQIDLRIFTSVVRESAPLAISSLGISLYMFVGPTILKYVRGDYEVGIFSAGHKLISVLTLIPASFTQVVYPIFSDFYVNAKDKLEKALQDAMRVMFQISLPVAVGLFILAPQVISFLYPHEFSDSSLVVRLMIAGNAFGFLAWILYTFLLAINEQNYCMKNALAFATFSFVASIIFIPSYGYKAVAFIAMITDVGVFLSLFVHARRIGYHVQSYADSLKIMFAGMLMGIGIMLMQSWNLLLIISLGTTCYLGLLVLLKVFGDQERELFSKLLKR